MSTYSIFNFILSSLCIQYLTSLFYILPIYSIIYQQIQYFPYFIKQFNISLFDIIFYQYFQYIKSRFDILSIYSIFYHHIQYFTSRYNILQIHSIFHQPFTVSSMFIYYFIIIFWHWIYFKNFRGKFMFTNTFEAFQRTILHSSENFHMKRVVYKCS